jgi:hypothetical protein
LSLTAPEEMPHAFARAWMARDAAALAALFAPDADFVNVVGIWWEDRTAIEAAHRYGLETFFAQSRLVAGRIKTRALGHDGGGGPLPVSAEWPARARRHRGRAAQHGDEFRDAPRRGRVAMRRRAEHRYRPRRRDLRGVRFGLVPRDYRLGE